MLQSIITFYKEQLSKLKSQKIPHKFLTLSFGGTSGYLTTLDSHFLHSNNWQGLSRGAPGRQDTTVNWAYQPRRHLSLWP